MEKLNLIGTQPFETKRMKLRAFKLSDAQYIYKNWASNENVTKYLTWNTHENLEVSTKFCVERTKLSGRTDNFDWVMVLNETSEPVGSIGGLVEQGSYDRSIGTCAGLSVLCGGL